LERKTGQLAGYLLEAGAIPSEPVCILVKRSIEMIMGILGILKAGCIYVPLNPKAPAERINYVLTDSGAKILLTRDESLKFVNSPSFLSGSSVLRSDLFLFFGQELKRYPERITNSPDAQIRAAKDGLSGPSWVAGATRSGLSVAKKSLPAAGRRPAAASFAYIIYTSGSTGKPKGVPITHANFSPLIHWGYCHVGIGPTDGSVQNLPYYFDWSVWEIFITLTSGASLYMVPESVIADADCYFNFIQHYCITVLHATPTHFQSLLHVTPGERLKNLKYLCFGAEKLNIDLVERSYKWIHKDCRVFNMYGPTEVTILSAIMDIDRVIFSRYRELSSVPIGGNVGNNFLLILDRYKHSCPLLVPGDLAIGGEGVARGYLNNPELTAERFLQPQTFTDIHRYILESSQSHSLTHLLTHSTIYWTGDIAKWLPDATIEFLGRKDFQVKIRGFRIELGEIEKYLLEHPGIKETVVTVLTNNNGDSYICAYVVPHLDKHNPIDISQLQGFLKIKLPDYMIPAYFVILDAMPLAPTGKVNRAALPLPMLKSMKEYVPPSGHIEQVLVKIWSVLLSIDSEKIGIDDNFFELGGHSLKINALLGRIYKKLKIELQFSQVFNRPTIREMAHIISGKEKSRYNEIPLIEDREFYSLSPAQKRLFVLQQLDTTSMVYHIRGFMVLAGELDREKMNVVFQRLVDRHESLRTSFAVINGEPVQRIHHKIKFEIEHHHAGVDGAVPAPGSFIRPFDLGRASLLRVGLVELEKKDTGFESDNPSPQSLLMVDMHHIISDGMSIEILIKEFMEFYAEKRLLPLKLQYRDYTQWHQSQALENAIKSQEIYWLKEFAGEIPVLNLPVDFPRPVVQVFEGAQTHFWIDKENTAAVQTIAIKEKTTLFGILLSIYATLLCRLSGQEDIVIGTPVTGRKNSALFGIIGMFVNMLALRYVFTNNRRFLEFLRESGKRLMGALENQEYQFEDLVERLNLNRDASRNPLFDVAFALQNPDMPRLEIPGLKATPYEYDPGIAKFDLTLIAEQKDNRLCFTVQYCTKLFKAETIERFSQYFKQLVASIVENPEQRISELNLLTPQEKQKLILEFNDTGAHYPNDKTIHGLFGEQVKKTPDGLALTGQVANFEFPDSQQESIQKEDKPSKSLETVGMVYLTYRELDSKTDRLADVLIEKECRINSIVAIKVERTVEMILGILGILKTGSAYLPIDPGSPDDRIDYMLKDSGAEICLTGNELVNLIDSPSFLSVSSVAKIFLPETSLAYIIYTSGSTGKPKGVPITHSNFSPLIHWGYRQLGIGSNDRALQNLSYFFDWSVWEIFITLTTGAGLYMVPKDVIMNPEKCIDFINRHALTVLHITPTHYTYLVNTGKSMETLCYLFIGAEKLTYDLVKRSINAVHPACRIFNMYGPTEATIISAVLEIDRSRVDEYKELSSVPIGNPSGNLFLLILDKYFNLCPVKVAGELIISGDGVAMGYLNNPELTIEKFLTTDGYGQNGIISYKTFGGGPGGGFSKEPPGGRRLYKTGDLARWLADGSVEFLGRTDHQVKIRGYRLELGEIENHLFDYPGITDAVLVVKENPSREKYLCAYIVTGEDFELSLLKKTLIGFLPDYMIPSYFVRMEKLPLNPNKKIDLKALPEPETTTLKDYEAPHTEIEMKLANLWSEILNIEKESISVESDFFKLGGHSLKATLLMSRIEREFQVKIPLTEIFVTPTIGGLAEIIGKETASAVDQVPLRPIEVREYYELSHGQAGMWMMHQLPGGAAMFNIFTVYTLKGNLDEALLARAFQSVVNRHESLRTIFIKVNDRPVQKILPPEESGFHLEIVDWLGDDRESNLNRLYRLGVDTPFDLSIGPLIKATLAKVEKHSYIFFILLHHIVSDAMSMEVMVGEVFKFLEGFKEGKVNVLHPLRIHYKDFAAWQNRNLEGDGFKGIRDYWHRQLVSPLPKLELPLDKIRLDMMTYNGNTVRLHFDAITTTKLNALSQQNDVTLFMLLLAALTVLFHQITGQTDIILGTPAMGRENSDLEGQIGIYINTVVLRLKFNPDKSFPELLEKVKTVILGALENQGYLFDMLVEDLGIERDSSRHPLFDVMVDMIDMRRIEEKLNRKDLEISPYEDTPRKNKFDLTLYIYEYHNSLDVELDFNTDLFEYETAAYIIESFERVIESIIEKPCETVAGLVVEPEPVFSPLEAISGRNN